MRLFEFLSDIGQPMPYYPEVARMLGVKPAIFLCRFIYWDGKQKDDDGWIWKSMDDIVLETGLSHEEQATCRRILKQKGVLEEWNNRLEHLMYYRVNFKVLDDLWALHKPQVPETVNHGSGVPGKTGSVPKPETTVSNISTKNTNIDVQNTLILEIYGLYPRKVAKPAALKAIGKALKKVDAETLKTATVNFSKAWDGVPDLTYCPHPATWFNQERYHDDPSTWVTMNRGNGKSREVLPSKDGAF